MLERRSSRFGSATSDALIARIRRLYLRHYRIPINEIDDLIDTALVDYLRARCSDQEDAQLLLVIARRRACDFCRRRQRERAIPQPERQQADVDQSRLEKGLFERMALRFADQRPRLNSARFVRVVAAILNDATVAEACRRNGIPRGSHPRYRALLQQCFGKLRPPRSG